MSCCLPTLVAAALWLSVAAPSHAAESARVAVPAMQVSGAQAGLGQTLTEILATELAEMQGLRVIGASDINAMLGFEREKELLGCEDNITCMAEIGGALGVDLLISSSLGLVGRTYVLNLKLIDTSKARVLKRVYETVTGEPDELIGVLRESIPVLVGSILPEAGKDTQPRASSAEDEGRRTGGAAQKRAVGDDGDNDAVAPGTAGERKDNVEDPARQASLEDTRPLDESADINDAAKAGGGGAVAGEDIRADVGTDEGATSADVPPAALRVQAQKAPSHWVQWTMIGVGGALLGLGATLEVIALQSDPWKTRTINDREFLATTAPDDAGIARTQSIAGISMIASGAALGIGGLIWLLTADEGESSQVSLVPSLSRDKAGFALRGAF